jgi:Glycosyltransferase family 87
LQDGGQTSEIQPQPSPLPWPRKLLGPAPGLREINLVCWGLLIGLVVVPLFTPIVLGVIAGKGIARILPLDFIYFYGIGRLVNEYSVGRLYDYSLQLRVFNQVYPLTDGAYGPSPYPPLVALFFSLFARLPLAAAYLLWMAASLALYVTGIRAAIRGAFVGKPLERSLIYCFAIAFFPFAVSDFANGQLVSAAVFAVGMAIYLERQSKPYASGLVLAILAYKPTLLLLILPMLLLTRRFRAIAGFLTGVAALVIFTTAVAGIGIWSSYLQFLRSFGRSAGPGGQEMLLRWKYVDLTSFSFALPGGRSTFGEAALSIVAGAAAIGLVILLWNSARKGNAAQSLAWAATLTWTLLLNIYVPIYDSALVTIAIFLTIGAVRELEWPQAERRTLMLAIFVFAISWVTLAFAKAHGLQLLTVALVILGAIQLRFLQKAIAVS